MSKSLELIFLKARNAGKRGDHAEAAALYEAILERFPGNARAQKAFTALRAQQAEAATAVPRAELDPLMALYRAGRWEAIAKQAGKLVARYPDAAVLHDLLGKSNLRLQRPAEAAEAFRALLAIKPEHAEGHNHLGIALKLLGRRAEAIASYRRALAIRPDYAHAHNNLGNMLRDIGQREEAAAAYRQAIAIQPDYAEPHNNLANILRDLGRCDEAVAAYARALELRPDYPGARTQKLHQQAHMCDWEGMAADMPLVPELGVSGDPVPPFSMLACDDHPARNRIRSERFCASQYGYSPLPPTTPAAGSGGRLKIGYFSADFHNHATMYLMARLFELHDRDRFLIHAYSYGPARDDEMRRRFKNAVDRFHDVRELDDRQVAELARKEGIDVAVDLKGYTTDMRLGIFAWRAAPVQISYLGYPGTLGAPFIDYMIADRIVIPDEQRRHYAEKIIYLPGSYQVNDDTRRISERTTTRGEQGLPERGFVFGCFNNSYKITSEEFDIWMRLLGRIEGSVLWLFEANRWAKDNLRKEAARRGIDPDRLVFAPPLPQAEHLARLRLADLFLDTFVYNAHTTASDALWAGLPVLTLAGQSFAARVAASLLHAVGLPELVTTSRRQYEDLAIDLASGAVKLAALRKKLGENLASAPLFRTESFVRHIEAAYQRAHEEWAHGRVPSDLSID